MSGVGEKGQPSSPLSSPPPLDPRPLGLMSTVRGALMHSWTRLPRAAAGNAAIAAVPLVVEPLVVEHRRCPAVTFPLLPRAPAGSIERCCCGAGGAGLVFFTM